MRNPVDLFVKQLNSIKEKPFAEVTERKYAGVSFLYIPVQDSYSQQEIETFLEQQAQRFTEGTAWFFEYDYVRTSRIGLIYRCRFRVPDEKSFCCGNQCPNCILLRNL